MVAQRQATFVAATARTLRPRPGAGGGSAYSVTPIDANPPVTASFLATRPAGHIAGAPGRQMRLAVDVQPTGSTSRAHRAERLGYPVSIHHQTTDGEMQPVVRVAERGYPTV